MQRYFDAHKQDYAQPESVRLSEILISTGTPAPSATIPGGVQPEDPAKVAAAKAKADDIEAKLKAGADFTAAGAQFERRARPPQRAAIWGNIAAAHWLRCWRTATFSLKTGEFTEPIRTKQGYVILKVVQHTPGGVPQYKDVEQDVEQAYYETKMMPAMRDYLTKMREDSYVEIKPGYVDTGASANARVLPITYARIPRLLPRKRRR